MIAVIELKGKQFRVSENQVIRTLRFGGNAGDQVEANQVLALIDGDKIEIGTPVLAGKQVVLEIVRQARSPKIKIFRYRKRTRTTRQAGYRDNISYLRVKQIKV